MTSWTEIIKEEKDKSYFIELKNFLKEQRTEGAVIYPEPKDIFKALRLTPLENVKVVILGQDPYHGQGQAHGLAFSVPHGVKKPPSLINMFKERKDSINARIPASGNLEGWARQGIFLLNTIMTVEAGRPASHHGKGWETFTDRLISAINDKDEQVVFCLWGAHAQSKSKLIDADKHIVLTAPHPSPLSAYKGFFGCGHFETIGKKIGWIDEKAEQGLGDQQG